MWPIVQLVVNGALDVAQEMLDCSPLCLPCTVVEACKHPAAYAISGCVPFANQVSLPIARR
jgi:hypothetical protein